MQTAVKEGKLKAEQIKQMRQKGTQKKLQNKKETVPKKKPEAAQVKKEITSAPKKVKLIIFVQWDGWLTNVKVFDAAELPNVIFCL